MEREFLESLVLTHQAELFRYMLYLGAEDVAAEDLVQDIFLTAYGSPTPCENMEPRLRVAWLRGIGRNLFQKQCRRYRRERIPLDPDRAEAVWKEEFLRGSDGFDYTEALRKCLESLPENQRKLVDLRYRSEASRAEMAQAFRITEDGVKSFLRRTRAVLGDCIEKRLKAEGAP